MSQSIGEILQEQLMSLMMSPELDGQQEHISTFMSRFSKPEGLPALTLWLSKVDIEQRFNLMNHMMLSCTDENFPDNSSLLWHALVNTAHTVLAVTSKAAVEDDKMASVLERYKHGENPYALGEPN